jgi:hypothetical protein
LALKGSNANEHSLKSADGSISDAVYVNNYGNVGIGCTNLDNTGSGMHGPFLQIGSSTTEDEGSIIFASNSGTKGGPNKFSIGLESIQDENVGRALHFRDLSANKSRMVINKNGKVGIGTTNPSEMLDVEGTIKANSFVGDGSALTGISCSCECDELLKIINLQQKIFSMDVGYSLRLPLSKTYWRRAYDGHIWDEGMWEETSEGLRVYGRGYREGNGINSKVSLNIKNTEILIQWKVNGNGQYAAFGLGIAGALNLFSGTTHHGSPLLSEDIWYFTRISINEDKSYTAVTATENYDISDGLEFDSKTGKLESYWHRLSNTVFDIRIGDNYGSTDAFIEIKEIIYNYKPNK